MQLTCVVCGNTFDYEPRRGGKPVTCSPECQRARKSVKSEESRTRLTRKDVPEHLHGTATGYTQYKCGCVKCMKWAREYKQASRKAGASRCARCDRYAQAKGLCATHFREEYGITLQEHRDRAEP